MSVVVDHGDDMYTIRDGYVVVYGDGSARFNMNPQWTYCSCSIFYAEFSPINLAFPLPGREQTIYMAELSWLYVAISRAWAPSIFYIDNQTVATQAKEIIDNPDIDVRKWNNASIWSDIQTAVHVARFKFHGHEHADYPFIIQWLPGHAGEEQVLQGLLEHDDILGNDSADTLAK
eukprot:9346737-Karenia_brevis.AAC.1